MVNPNTYLPSKFDLESFLDNFEEDTACHCIYLKSKQEYLNNEDLLLEELCIQVHLLKIEPIPQFFIEML